MATGLPVVATRCGGPEEIIEHEQTGLLVASNNPLELANGLKRLIEDEDLRLRLSSDGRKHVESVFSFKAMLCAYKDIYEIYKK
jgi:glycosyltransferase involved in cell wall biosynthesis